jgi:NodT family efflux transporter outer membrane factor (OMF) lipoprotein
VGLPSSLLTVRPDIIAAEHQLQASRAQVGAARAAFFPRIALTGSWGSGSAELSGLFESSSQAWTFMPSIALPIFDGGRRQANLDLAAVRQNAAVVTYERTIQTAFREVADALAMRQGIAQQVDIQQSNLQSLQERARLAQLRYDNGASPYLDVLDAQRELLSAAQQLVQARYALQSAYVSLYTALGGGTSLGTAVPAASATTPTPNS